MTEQSEAFVDVTYNQLETDVEADYGAMVERLSAELYGLRRSYGAVDASNHITAAPDGLEENQEVAHVTIDSQREEQAVITLTTRDTKETRHFAYVDGIVWQLLPEVSQQIVPGREGLQSAMLLIRAVHTLRTHGQEW